MANNGTIRSADVGGVSGVAAPVPARTQVAPSTEKAQLNTIRPAVFPIACWKAEDVNFAFDSSFIQPAVAAQMPRLKELQDEHPGASVSVFGHADPVGNDDYNKQLSGRRAQAVYALLTRRTDLWEELAAAGDWKTAHFQVILATVGPDPERTDGVMDPAATAALKEFQQTNGTPNDGKFNKDTRKKLFQLYMDALCRDAEGKPFKVGAEFFLGAGRDKGGKADYQGCSEFNPVLLFSKEHQDELDQDKDKTSRNASNAPNRRVLVLLFSPGSSVDPARWPCPRVKEGTAACRKRFWSDADKRKKLTDEQREFQETHDTFQCRFYERLTTSSPCERASLLVVARLYDETGKHIPFAPYTLVAGSTIVNDVADARGFVILAKQPDATKGTITWTLPKKSIVAAQPAAPFAQDVFFGFNDDDDKEAFERLLNLGFGDLATLGERVQAFQNEYKDDFDVETDGKLGPKTRDAIVKVHDQLADNIRDPQAKSAPQPG